MANTSDASCENNSFGIMTFDTYTATLVDQLNKSTYANFRTYNRFVSSIIDEHRFLSALRTNFYSRSVPGSGIYVTFPGNYPQKVNLSQPSFMPNETCRCDRTSEFIYPAGIYNQSKVIIPNELFSHDASLVFAIPGFQVGCTSQNALLQSTLECFYNQSCLDMIITLTDALRTVSALNISSYCSRFDSTTTISVIFDNLMLESWEDSTDLLSIVEQSLSSTREYSRNVYYVPADIRVSDSWLCSCAWGSLCLRSLGFYCSSSSCVEMDSEPNETVPGLDLSCQLLDFTYSTPQWFFNQSCVQMLIDERLYGYENVYLPVDLSNITVLDPETMATCKPEYPFNFLMIQVFIDQ
ncbi:unnamed protein product [Rotaria sp. Silwood2]|nr:unnamed protein product [Rotaria sp. Silwood2]